jgi:hypothetical protein
MSKTKAILLSAVAGLGLSATVNAAPIVTTRLTLLETDGTTVINPSSPGVYNLPSGKHFLVQLGAAITPGTENFTDSGSSRATVTRNQPLGIAVLAVDILGSAAVSPVNDAGSWKSYTDLTPDGLAYSSQPVGDSNADADALPFDVPGAGFANTSLSTGTSLALMSKTQYGVATHPLDYVAGEFVANATGTISTVKQALNVFADAAANNNNLDAPDDIANMSNTSIQVNVAPIPEPASLGLLSLVGLAIGRRRRA